MFKWEVLGFKALRNLKRQVFYRNLWHEKTRQRYCSSKTKFLKINFDSVCQIKGVNVYGLS